MDVGEDLCHVRAVGVEQAALICLFSWILPQLGYARSAEPLVGFRKRYFGLCKRGVWCQECSRSFYPENDGVLLVVLPFCRLWVLHKVGVAIFAAGSSAAKLDSSAARRVVVERSRALACIVAISLDEG